MTFSGLFFYLLHRRVSLTDHIAVGKSLLHDPAFRLGKFLIRIVLWTFVIETIGAICIYILSQKGFTPYSAVFHAISAYCNAGFSLNKESLVGWQGNLWINFIFMALIILGGIGFSVLVELQTVIKGKVTAPKNNIRPLSWYSHVVLTTSAALILGGWLCIYLAESTGFSRSLPQPTALLSALFQSVTCRTAGFNTLDIGQMTNVSLLIMMLLMFIGGAPGSCAGGVKVTTFRALIAFVVAQIKGQKQAVVKKFAIGNESMSNALILLVFAGLIIFSSALLLNITEGGNLPHPLARGLFTDVLFEVVSAFGTVGLSTGLTPKLSVPGKIIITVLMFIGRLGPIVLLSAVQSFQRKKLFEWPEQNMLIG